MSDTKTIPPAAASSSQQAEASFVVQCLGQIDGASMDDHDYLYCRYMFSYGADWDIVAGIDSGLSQTSCRNNMNCDKGVVWNFPVDISFKSTNVHGWPRIALSVYGIDYFGRDVIRGYGSALIPLQAGTHHLEVEMFTPVANSGLNQVASWLFGNPPEFFDSRFVCQGEGREVSRVAATGKVTVTLQVVVKGLEKFGYCL